MSRSVAQAASRASATRSRAVGLSVWWLTLALLASMAFPSATIGTDNKNKKWNVFAAYGYDHWITFKMDSSVPTGDFRTYIERGRTEWNNVGRELWFSWSQSTSSPKVVITYELLGWPNEGKLAIAIVYSCGGAYSCTGTIAFNTTPSNNATHWYGNGLLSCPKVDLHSLSAHEFGHLVSLLHSGPSADTMYATIPCGSTAKRSLTTHDKAGIESYYPAH